MISIAIVFSRDLSRGQRLDRVHQQVQKHLDQSRFGGEDERRIRGVAAHQLRLVFELVFDDAERRIEHHAQIEQIRVARVLAGEGLEIEHDRGHALDAFARFGERLAGLAARRRTHQRELLLDEREVCGDVRERVVDLVRDARGELSNRGHAIGLQHARGVFGSALLALRLDLRQTRGAARPFVGDAQAVREERHQQRSNDVQTRSAPRAGCGLRSESRGLVFHEREPSRPAAAIIATPIAPPRAPPKNVATCRQHGEPEQHRSADPAAQIDHAPRNRDHRDRSGSAAPDPRGRSSASSAKRRSLPGFRKRERRLDVLPDAHKLDDADQRDRRSGSA